MWRSTLAFLATIPALVALAVLPLLMPPFVHAALDAAGSATSLGVDAAMARELSDRSVRELVVGTGTFELFGPDGEPFYDSTERRHLRDARALLWLCLVAGAVSATVLALLLVTSPRRTPVWRAVSRAGAAIAIGVIVVGLVGVVAFDSLFTLFHQAFFPGGGWAFDPTRQHLVQLYPMAFWQVTATAFGLMLFLLGVLAWWLGRAQAAADR